jgi:hypothetical protein
MIGLVSQDRELIRIGCIDITRRIREKNPRDDEKLNEPGDGT